MTTRRSFIRQALSGAAAVAAIQLGALLPRDSRERVALAFEVPSSLVADLESLRALERAALDEVGRSWAFRELDYAIAVDGARRDNLGGYPSGIPGSRSSRVRVGGS